MRWRCFGYMSKTTAYMFMPIFLQMYYSASIVLKATSVDAHVYDKWKFQSDPLTVASHWWRLSSSLSRKYPHLMYDHWNVCKQYKGVRNAYVSGEIKVIWWGFFLMVSWYGNDFPHRWPFVKRTHRSPVYSLDKGPAMWHNGVRSAAIRSVHDTDGCIAFAIVTTQD